MKTLEKLREFISRGRKAQGAVDDVLLMQRVRTCLTRWASCRARSARAKERMSETRPLIADLDDWLLKNEQGLK
jgi:hypothetical protein